MNELVKNLIQTGVLKTPRIIEAFKAIDRKDFVPEEYRDEAYGDYPIPIGYGQTISQPTTVALMLELLQPEEGNKVLDVGSGSGWQTALLAYIVSNTSSKDVPRNSAFVPRKSAAGKVFGIELVPEIEKIGEENVAKYNFIEKGIVTMLQMSAQNGIPQEAPFDRIIAAASAESVPKAWQEQLAIGGRMVLPIKESVWLYIKNPDGTFFEEEHPGFAFVPFVT